MIRIIFILIMLIIASCGARKKERYSKQNSQSITTQEMSQTDVSVLQISSEQFKELLFDIQIRGTSLTTDTQGKLTISNPDITIKGNETESLKKDTSQIDTTNIDDKKTDKNKDSLVEGIKVDRKQFNWWLSLPLVFIVLGIIWFFISYKKRNNKWK